MMQQSEWGTMQAETANTGSLFGYGSRWTAITDKLLYLRSSSTSSWCSLRQWKLVSIALSASLSRWNNTVLAMIQPSTYLNPRDGCSHISFSVCHHEIPPPWWSVTWHTAYEGVQSQPTWELNFCCVLGIMIKDQRWSKTPAKPWAWLAVPSKDLFVKAVSQESATHLHCSRIFQLSELSRHPIKPFENSCHCGPLHHPVLIEKHIA